MNAKTETSAPFLCCVLWSMLMPAFPALLPAGVGVPAAALGFTLGLALLGVTAR